MTLTGEHLAMGMTVATVVVPVGMYFLILGLLNSRRRPQLLTGRRDFAILILALCPLFVLPLVAYVGHSPLGTLLVIGATAAAIWAMSPRGRTWVIYNLAPDRASEAVGRALEAAGCTPRRRTGGFDLADRGAEVNLSGFPLLRNVSVRMVGCDPGLVKEFERRLESELAGIRVESSPMAVAMLLVATGMLVAPLTVVAHRAGQIVRILTDLLK